jgi:hypothetical protein
LDFTYRELIWLFFYFSLQRFHHRWLSCLLVKREAGGNDLGREYAKTQKTKTSK